METFVIRVFVPADDAELEPTGFVEHVGTRRSRRFQGPQGLIDAVLHGLKSRQDNEEKEEKR